MSREYDYIIVGQGLAGTCLAQELLSLGCRIRVFDDHRMPSSTRVAKGLFNPVTGRHMVLTWKAHELFSCLQDFYRQLEGQLQERFLYPMPVYRPFLSRNEQNDWLARMASDRYAPFIGKVETAPLMPGVIHNPLGGIMLARSGYLDTGRLLDAYRHYLRSRGLLVEERFEPDELNFDGPAVVYKEYRARKVIFCDGPAGVRNKWLEQVKWRPVKGEVLELEMDIELDFIVNRQVFLMPRSGTFFAGSNYTWQDQTWEPTGTARKEILGKLDKLVKARYRVVSQRAGIRPTTHDRRPVLGLLPHQPQVGVFNGLGTKGVSLAPYFARQMARFLEKGGEICREAGIGRYFK